jgi:uncharacterized protein YecE (DUF72 family)
MATTGNIRVGIGGWTYEPWRGTFYPADLPAKRELEHASRRLTAIEVNGTFYRTQSAASFAKWRDETPESFVFTLKGHRAVVNKRKLAEAGETVEWFLKSGIAELGEKLGPLLWQFAPFKRFDPDDIDAFLALLPREVAGLPLKHAIEVRHQSFCDPAFVALARKHTIGIVYADSEEHPAIADDTADFVYARLMKTVEAEPAGYSKVALDQWAERAKVWAAGGVPEDLPRVEPIASGKNSAARKGKSGAKVDKRRPVFVFFISGAKVRAPIAAEALIKRLKA